MGPRATDSIIRRSVHKALYHSMVSVLRGSSYTLSGGVYVPKDMLTDVGIGPAGAGLRAPCQFWGRVRLRFTGHLSSSSSTVPSRRHCTNPLGQGEEFSDLEKKLLLLTIE